MHTYVPSAPGCWQIFGEVQANELQRFGYPPAHRLIVDAYMAQHPGDGSDRRDRQSVFAHLAGLYARLELDLAAERAGQIVRRIVSRRADFPILRRDRGPGELTIQHMVGARDQADYEARAQDWAQSVWRSWTVHHSTVAAAVQALTAD
ncbi:MAG: hypothetical protein JOZ07_14105 [Solirubrobacterales bacterium]|nr:hypothetical protein [Solirubrobacterales bacterium]